MKNKYYYYMSDQIQVVESQRGALFLISDGYIASYKQRLCPIMEMW